MDQIIDRMRNVDKPDLIIGSFGKSTDWKESYKDDVAFLLFALKEHQQHIGYISEALEAQVYVSNDFCEALDSIAHTEKMDKNDMIRMSRAVLDKHVQRMEDNE